MSFNFDDLLQQGKNAAENVLQNKKEVKEVLNDLKKSLAKFLNLKIELVERIEYVTSPDPFSALTSSFKPREKTGFNVVYIKSKEVDVDKVIFKLKRSEDVYPITISRDKNHIVSDDQNEFVNAVGQVVSNSQLHLQLNSFKRKVEETLSERPKPIPKAD